MTAEAIVERQVDAYNARDLDRFVATFSDAILIYRMPSIEPVLSGKAQLAEFYATQRFNRPGLRAEIMNRIVLGNKVTTTSGSRESTSPRCRSSSSMKSWTD